MIYHFMIYEYTIEFDFKAPVESLVCPNCALKDDSTQKEETQKEETQEFPDTQLEDTCTEDERQDNEYVVDVEAWQDLQDKPWGHWAMGPWGHWAMGPLGH